MKSSKVYAVEIAEYMTVAIVAVYPQIILRNRGLSMTTVGVVSSLGQLAMVFLPLLIGALSSKVKKDSRILASCVLALMAVCIPATVGKNDIIASICAILMMGIIGSTLPKFDGYLNRFYNGDSSKYTNARSIGSVAYIVVLVLTKLIAFPSETNNAEILIAALVTSSCFFVASLFLPVIPNENKESKGYKLTGFGKQFYFIMLAAGICKIASVTVEKFISTYMIEELHFGNSFTVFSAVATFGEFVAMRIAAVLLKKNKTNYYKLLTVTFAGYIIRLIVLRFTHSLAFFVISQLLGAFTYGTFNTGVMAYIGRNIEHDMTDCATTFYWTISVNLPQMIGLMAGGWVIDNLGYTSLFSLSMIFPIVSLLIILLKRKLLAPAYERA